MVNIVLYFPENISDAEFVSVSKVASHIAHATKDNVCAQAFIDTLYGEVDFEDLDVQTMVGIVKHFPTDEETKELYFEYHSDLLQSLHNFHGITMYHLASWDKRGLRAV